MPFQSLPDSNNNESDWSFPEGLARVSQNGKWVFINIKGEETIPCIYDDYRPFSEGLARVSQGDWKNRKYGYIDTKGRTVVPCVYDDARDFSEGLARVEQNGKYGYIDTKGRIVIPCVYDSAGDFKDGLANVTLILGSNWGDRINYIINREGIGIIAGNLGDTYWSEVEE